MVGGRYLFLCFHSDWAASKGELNALIDIMWIILGLLLIPLTISIIDFYYNKGKETVKLNLPGWEPGNLQNALKEFFINKNMKYELYENRIIGYRGSKWLMGIKTFDIHITKSSDGCLFTGQFYLESVWPFRYMKFSRYGYLAGLPRRMGWKIKNKMFEFLEENNSTTTTDQPIMPRL